MGVPVTPQESRSQWGELEVLAGGWATGFSSHAAPGCGVGGVVACLGLLSGFLFQKRLLAVEDPRGIPGRPVRWAGCGPQVRGHRDILWDLWAKKGPSGNLRKPHPQGIDYCRSSVETPLIISLFSSSSP